MSDFCKGVQAGLWDTSLHCGDGAGRDFLWWYFSAHDCYALLAGFLRIPTFLICGHSSIVFRTVVGLGRITLFLKFVNKPGVSNVCFLFNNKSACLRPKHFGMTSSPPPLTLCLTSDQVRLPDFSIRHRPHSSNLRAKHSIPTRRLLQPNTRSENKIVHYQQKSIGS